MSARKINDPMTRFATRFCIVFLSSVTLCLSLGGPATASILISQYAEDGNIKGVELWNPGPNDIDFSSQILTVANFNNGSTTATYTFTKSTGVLPAGNVLVLADGSANGNGIWTSSGIAFEQATFNFNGDDALEVRLGGSLTDMFGVVGVDPGSRWIGNGVATENQNIQLLEGPNIILTGSLAGFTDPSTRFTTVATAPLDSGTGPDLLGFGVAPVTPVPEPSTLALAGIGLVAGSWLARRRRFTARRTAA